MSPRFGTSLFLKRAYGPGYRLGMVKGAGCTLAQVRELVRVCRLLPEREVQPVRAAHEGAAGGAVACEAVVSSRSVSKGLPIV